MQGPRERRAQAELVIREGFLEEAEHEENPGMGKMVGVWVGREWGISFLGGVRSGLSRGTRGWQGGPGQG